MAEVHSGTYEWYPQAGVAVRGSVVLLAGRGEHAGVYGRFGARIASDGYAVVSADGIVARTTGDPEAVLAKAVADLAAPVVLVGSDAGAYLALRLAAATPVSAVVLAGVADGTATVSTDWDDELDARTACPVHRGVLADELVRGALAEPVDIEVEPAAVGVPVLVVHGEQDRVAPLSVARALVSVLPRAELAVVRGGRHDVLNDLQHRTVAAEIVQFLERVRAAEDAAPLLSRVKG